MEKIKMNKKQDFFYCYNMIFSMDISAHAKLVYTYLCRCADSEAKSFPSRNTIASACNIGLTSVRNALKELVEVRLLKKQEQFRDNGGQTSNLYTVFSEPYKDSQKVEESVGESTLEADFEANDTGKSEPISKYAPQPSQNITVPMSKCAHQEVIPKLSNTHNQVRFNNGERIRDTS